MGGEVLLEQRLITRNKKVKVMSLDKITHNFHVYNLYETREVFLFCSVKKQINAYG